MVLVRDGDMSNVCAFRQTKATTTVGKWVVRPASVGRRSPPAAVCENRADSGPAPPLGWRAPSGAAQFRCRICDALGSAKRREAVVEEYKNRRGFAFARKDVFVACPWTGDLRRASSVELRSALLRVMKHLPPANSPGLEDVLGRGCEAPSGGTSLLLTSA